MDYAEPPLSSCSDFAKPYKTMNNSCSNFKDVCIKTGDKDCDNFQKVCEQCPSSNFTILMYLNMINMRDQITTMKINDLPKIGNNLIILYLLVGIIIGLLLLIFLEVRFKLITKCCTYNKTQKYKLIESRKSNQQKESVNLLLDSINKQHSQYNQMAEINPVIDNAKRSDLQVINDKIVKIENSLDKTINLSKNSMMFKIAGAPRPIELFIIQNENVLQVKRRICSHWPAAKPTDYKIMVIKSKGRPLNDQKIFMSNNIPSNFTFDCELDHSINPSDFLILKLQGNLDLPELLKIPKDKTISDLKTFIKYLNNISLNPICREMKTGRELKDEWTLEKCQLQDDDWIDIITEMKRKLTAISIFNETESCVVEFSNIDMILTIKNQIKKQLNLKSENIVLFWNNLHLDDDKYINDYNINEECQIKYCCLNMFDEKAIPGKNLCKFEFYQLFIGNNSGQNVFIQKYVLIENVFITKSSSFITQLINHQIINSNPRFMSLVGICLNKSNLFLLMENKSEKIIVEIIKNGSTPLDNEIAKWSTQILEGLKYFHDNNIIHKNLKPTNIFVDNARNIKLSCFNMIQSLDADDERILDVHPFPLRYWAPEVLKEEPFTIKSDVWSFGAVLVFIATGDKPNPNESESEAAIDIKKYGRIEFEKKNISDEFLKFINDCLIADQNERPDVDTLLQHSFLKQLSL